MKTVISAILCLGISMATLAQDVKPENSSQLESLTPNLMVKSVNKTIEYYINQLGFDLIDTNPKVGEYAWGFIRLGDVRLMFQEENSMKEEFKELNKSDIGGGLTFYIRVKNINDYYNSIKDKVKVIKPINKTFYGTNEFAIMDLNGYVLTFSENAS